MHQSVLTKSLCSEEIFPVLQFHRLVRPGVPSSHRQTGPWIEPSTRNRGNGGPGPGLWQVQRAGFICGFG